MRIRTCVLSGAVSLASLLGAAVAPEFRGNWPRGVERPWAGPDYWTNPLQDWRVAGGRLECFRAGGDRNVFLLTREAGAQPGTIETSVKLGRLDPESAPMEAGFVGFRLGIRGLFHDYRDSAVRGNGLDAGMTSDRLLFIGHVGTAAPKVNGRLDDIELRLRAEPAGAAYRVTLAAFDRIGAKLAELSRTDIRPEWLRGGLALVCSSARVTPTPVAEKIVRETGWQGKPGTQRGGTMRFWFRDWRVSGSKISAQPGRAFGPILFALHTRSRGVLKMTAQMAPVQAGGTVRLQIREGKLWKTVASAPVDPMSRTATFRINWDDTKDTPYRLAYTMEGRTHYYGGTVARDPVSKPRITVAAFTGNNDLGFPHADVVRHVRLFRPDLLAFTGDQIYERVGEYGIQRAPIEAATLDYLRKWYIFGWEYRDLLKDIPAVCLPDDHDVYHGNLWGAGGRVAKGEGQPGQDSGGYTMPAAWVNMVQRTQTSHMADPFDPTPAGQGITVYYGPMTVGGVSFAILEDRKWKSPPREFLPKAQIVNGWPQNPAYDAARDGDAPGAQLLGERQMRFLERWVRDWSGGAWMKAALSQTLFATVATLPASTRNDSVVPKLKIFQPGEYPPDDVPTMDHDSNGWPQTPRTEALRLLRQGLAFHISGDQHLGSTIQYGIDGWNDGPWAICVPSVANIFPRRWFPREPGRNRKPGAPRYTGEFLDGFGNRITVHAVSNPMSSGVEPAALYDRAPGYGIVTFDRATRKITVANWPRWVDPAKPRAKPYPGWPITIDQADNGLPHSGWVLEKVAAEIDDPVVEVTDQASGKLVYAIRIQGRSFVPPVWKEGTYTVKVWDPDKGYERSYRDRKAVRGM